MKAEIRWWNTKPYIKQVENRMERVLRIGGEIVYQRSQVYCPVDMITKKGGGTLLRSGDVAFEERSNKFAVIISYNTPYALVQHEKYPRKTKPGAKMKYLEDALNENKARILRLFKEALGGV